MALDYTEPQLNETIRKTLAPSSYVSYLPVATPYTTGTILTASGPTKVLVPTTIKSSNDFAIVDRGGGNYAVQYQGDETRTFKVFMSSGVSSGTPNITFGIYMYLNDVFEEGTGVTAKLGSIGDKTNVAIVGEFTCDPNSYLEIYVDVSSDSTITFDRTSIIFTEKN